MSLMASMSSKAQSPHPPGPPVYIISADPTLMQELSEAVKHTRTGDADPIVCVLVHVSFRLGSSSCC